VEESRRLLSRYAHSFVQQVQLWLTRAVDVGASQLIIDGKIKLKNDSFIERFTNTGIKFENGSELPADVVVFATG
jgi:hypothetical protein